MFLEMLDTIKSTNDKRWINFAVVKSISCSSSNSAVSGMVRGQSFCVKLKARTKGWVAHYVRLTSLLGW
jgi:hypothetical protein